MVCRSISWQACEVTPPFPAACASIPMDGDKNNTAAVHTASNALIPLFNVFPEKIDFFTFSLLSHPLHIFCALYLYYNLRTTSAFFILPGLPAASGKKRL